jgi:glycosyltransferase involved in cell wall biosynthesis
LIKLEGGLRTKGINKELLLDFPLVSIVTVVFNGSRFLDETIASVCNQSYRNIEYIIIDGGSTDSTLDIIKAHESEIDYWISEPDGGIYDAMNKGISLCSGNIIKLINADDRLTVGSVELAVSKYNELLPKGDDFFIAGYLDIINGQGDIIGLGNKISFTKYFDSFLHPSWYVPATIYERFGPYSLDYSISSDYEYYLRLTSRSISMEMLEIPLAQYRKGGASSGLLGVPQVFIINKSYFGFFRAIYVAILISIRKIAGSVIRGMLRKK